MNFQTVQNFLKVLSIFLETVQAIKSPQSFRIFFIEFTNTQELPEGSKYFSKTISRLLECLEALNIFSQVVEAHDCLSSF